MTAEEYLKEKGFSENLMVFGNKIFGSNYVSDLLEDYTKLKCKEQREICERIAIEHKKKVWITSSLFPLSDKIKNAPEPEI